MGRFDQMCNEVMLKDQIRKRKYTYRLFTTACPYFHFVFRATNKSINCLDASWEPYAVQINDRWKKIVLLDAYH